MSCVLTTRGRELLSKGKHGDFEPKFFALADDEIDYSLWNPDHPLGSAYYGIVIENLPITENFVDPSVTMKYKLVTLPKKTIRIPVINVPNTSITLKPGQSIDLTPQTINYTEGNTTFGYIFTLADSDVCSMFVKERAKSQKFIGDTTSVPTPVTDSEAGQAITVTGKSVTLTANLQQLAAKTTTLTITGAETGGRVVVNITVEKVTTNTTPNLPLTGQPPISLP